MAAAPNEPVNPIVTATVAPSTGKEISDPLRLCRIVTVPQTFQTLLREQLRCISAHGVDLTLVCSPGPELEMVAQQTLARAIGLPIRRQPAPIADLWALFHLLRLFRRCKFDVVHSSTPKAGFLAALAARAVGVRTRIHTFTGQPWVELGGLAKWIPRECDRVTASMATQCYADSPSQRDFLIAEGLVSSQKIAVVGAGSISGVDLDRFSTAKWGGLTAAQTRSELGVPTDDLIIAFVGRVTKDKGISELVTAFDTISRRHADVHLVLVGPLEPERDPLPTEVMNRMNCHQRIHTVGFSSTPEKYLAVANIFCLPSYREGFGSVVIEAAAMGLPAVVTRVTGLVDAVEEGETGIIVPAKDVERLAEALKRLMVSPDLRKVMGRAAQLRAKKYFDARIVNEAVALEYIRLANRSHSHI